MVVGMNVLPTCAVYHGCTRSKRFSLASVKIFHCKTLHIINEWHCGVYGWEGSGACMDGKAVGRVRVGRQWGVYGWEVSGACTDVSGACMNQVADKTNI